MSINELLEQEFDEEMAATRQLLERIPENSFAWKPHAKSFSMGALASHVADLIKWTNEIMERPSFDLETINRAEMMKVAATPAELLTWFDANASAARALFTKSDADYYAPWSLLQGNTVFFTRARYRCLRNIVLNHLIHHRAQLTVYLRLNDVPLPKIYGPTADET